MSPKAALTYNLIKLNLSSMHFIPPCFRHVPEWLRVVMAVSSCDSVTPTCPLPMLYTVISSQVAKACTLSPRMTGARRQVVCFKNLAESLLPPFYPYLSPLSCHTCACLFKWILPSLIASSLQRVGLWKFEKHILKMEITAYFMAFLEKPLLHLPVWWEFPIIRQWKLWFWIPPPLSTCVSDWSCLLQSETLGKNWKRVVELGVGTVDVEQIEVALHGFDDEQL